MKHSSLTLLISLYNSRKYSSLYCLREYVDVFFVPLRLLWDKFPQFVIQTDHPVYSQSLTQSASNFSVQPYITDADIHNYLAAFFNQTVNTVFMILIA